MKHEKDKATWAQIIILNTDLLDLSTCYTFGSNLLRCYSAIAQDIKMYQQYMYSLLSSCLCSLVFFTLPRNHGGVIFSLQSVCVCVCVRLDILVNEIPAERMHRFGRGFR